MPGFGDPEARLLILGLAPAAHGANRTGRVFTGDRSGDLLFRVLHETGFANQATAVSASDGMRLRGAWIASVVRCAPPKDKPTPEEIRNCAEHMAAETGLLEGVRVVVCLGRVAWDGFLAHQLQAGLIPRKAAYRFAHGARHTLPHGTVLLGSYHPSPRNTNTGRLSMPMLLRVFAEARSIAFGPSGVRQRRAIPAAAAMRVLGQPVVTVDQG